MSVLIDRIIGLLALILVGGTMAAYQWHIPDCRRVAMMSGIILAGVIVGLVVFDSRRLRRLTGLDFILRRLPMQPRRTRRSRQWRSSATARCALPWVFAAGAHDDDPVGHVRRLGLPAAAAGVLLLGGRAGGGAVGAIPISPQGAGVMEFFAVERPAGTASPSARRSS